MHNTLWKITGIMVGLVSVAACHGDPSAISGGGTSSQTSLSNPHFAAGVHAYRPAPGQFLESYGDPVAALGIPDGRVVTLGGFGGSLTLRLVTPMTDRPAAADLVLWGNAQYVGGDPRSRWAEPGLVEVSPNGSDWYLIGGSFLTNGTAPRDMLTNVVYSRTNDNTWPDWAAASNSIAFSNVCLNGWFVQRLDDAYAYTNSDAANTETLYGYADCTPTGSGDWAGDAWQPDQPLEFGTQSGGGDAVMLEWAVDYEGNSLYDTIRHLTFYYVRITTAVYYSAGVLGEISTEIDAIGVPP